MLQSSIIRMDGIKSNVVNMRALPLSVHPVRTATKYSNVYYVEPVGQRQGIYSISVRVVYYHHDRCLCVFGGDTSVV